MLLPNDSYTYLYYDCIVTQNEIVTITNHICSCTDKKWLKTVYLQYITHVDQKRSGHRRHVHPPSIAALVEPHLQPADAVLPSTVNKLASVCSRVPTTRDGSGHGG